MGRDASDEIIDSRPWIDLRPPLVMVDGYNVIGAMNDPRHHGTYGPSEISATNLEDARDGLVADMSMLKGSTGWDIVVVFDAYNEGRDSELVSMREGLWVVFTAGTDTADTYIERRCHQLSRKGGDSLPESEGDRDIVVVTNDLILQSVAGSYHASVLPVSSLFEEVRLAYMSWEKEQRDMQITAQQRRPRLGDALSDEMKGAIAAMKRGESMH